MVVNGREPPKGQYSYKNKQVKKDSDKNKSHSKMFPFITQTWNPLGGECLHKCVYCWATALKERYPNLKAKYGGTARIIDKEFKRIANFKATDFIFVCDMTDLFGYWVPNELIQQILIAIKDSPAQFLLLTKNPKRYNDLISIGIHIPLNCILGATIESDINHLLTVPVSNRLESLANLSDMGYPVMISIEPIMKFDYTNFGTWLRYIMPKFVAVGYDNYNHGLPEPSLEETLRLIALMQAAGIVVYKKTLREAKP
jgi:DNA repair photolyase